MYPLLTRVLHNGVRGVQPVEAKLTGSALRPGPFVITGRAVSGKTTLLEAILAAKEACAAYGPPPRAADWFDDPSSGRIELRWHTEGTSAQDQACIWAPADPRAATLTPDRLRATLRAYSRESSAWKVEYFHADRRLDPGRPTDELSPLPPPLGAERIGTGAAKYNFVRAFIVSSAFGHATGLVRDLQESGLMLADGTPSPASRFGARLGQLTDRLLFLGVREGNGELRCLFSRRAARGHRDVELAQLTDSERMLVLYAATFEAMGLERALVLIDGLELHLPPEDQIRALEAWRSWTSAGQLIVSTTSPALLRAVSADQVLVLE